MHGEWTQLLTDLSHGTAQAFFAGLWQGLLLAVAVAVSLRMLPRVGAAVRFAIWGITFALIAVLPLVHAHGAVAGAGNLPSSTVVHVGAGWGFAVAGLWVGLTMLRLGQLATDAVRLRRIWNRARPIGVDVSELITGRYGGREAEICKSVDVDSPSVIGFLSPRLLVPEGMFAELSEVDLKQIVLHECEHLRRRDDWMNLVQKIGLAVFPLNPALLWVDRRLSLERELACDAGVVAATKAPVGYASCLTRLAEHRMRGRRVGLALSAWSRQSELGRRVWSLLRPMHAMSAVQARVAMAVLTVGLVGTAVEMARAPRLIAFTDATPVAVADVTTPVAGRGMGSVVPVGYRGDVEARPVMVSSVALLATSQKRDVGHPTRRMQVALQPTTQRRDLWQPSLESISQKRDMRATPQVVMTSAQMVDDGVQQPVRGVVVRRVVAVSPRFSYSYAAVPFADGWLIVQL